MGFAQSIVDSKTYDAFWKGFSKAHLITSAYPIYSLTIQVIDVGSGKERADTKIKGNTLTRMDD